MIFRIIHKVLQTTILNLNFFRSFSAEEILMEEIFVSLLHVQALTDDGIPTASNARSVKNS